MSDGTSYKVGDAIPPRKWTPTTLQLCQYAEASGDFNLIHLDEDYAQKAGLGGVIAHGMLTMAQLGLMLTDWIQEQGERGTLNRFEVTFKKMVHPGDSILCTGVIQEVAEGTVRLIMKATNQDDDVVVSGTALVNFK